MNLETGGRFGTVCKYGSILSLLMTLVVLFFLRLLKLKK